MNRTPAGPPYRFPLGILPDFFRDPLGTVTSAAYAYGSIIPLPTLPGVRVFLLNHPDTIREVLVERASSFAKLEQFKKIFRVVFGNGLFFSEGAFWRRQRRLMQPAFHHKQIQAYAETMTRHTAEMQADWQPGQTRQIDADMHALTLRIVLRSIFDAEAGERATQFRQKLTEIGELLTRQTFSIANFLPEWLPLPIFNRKRRLTQDIDAIVYDFIAEKRAAPEGSDDLLSTMMRAVDEETGERMDDRQLRDEVLTLFIAGHETTAHLMTWVWALLAQHPDVEAALHREVDTMLGGRLATIADLPKLPLTEQIVRETLRLCPIAWINFREASEDVVIGGMPVPKGSQIWFIPYTLHHDPRFFEDPERFSPERFAEGWEDRIPKHAYFPFGGGPRVCIGNGFAILEARLILATVASRYRLTLPPDHAVEVSAGALLTVKGGLPMKVEAR